MRAELASHTDFKEEKTKIEHFLNDLYLFAQLSLRTKSDRAMLGTSQKIHMNKYKLYNTAIADKCTSLP